MHRERGKEGGMKGGRDGGREGGILRGRAGWKVAQNGQVVIFLNGMSVMRFGQRGLTWH